MNRSNTASIIFHLILLIIIFSTKNPHVLMPSRSDGIEVSLISDDQITTQPTNNTQQNIVVQPTTETAADINLKNEKIRAIQNKIEPKTQLIKAKETTLNQVVHNEPHKAINKPTHNKKIQSAQQINDLLNQIPTDQPRGRSKHKTTGGTSAGTANTNNLISGYADSVIRLLRPYIIIPDNIDSRATAMVQVTLLPNLTVYQVKLLKSSGNMDYDDSVQQSIVKAHTFPQLPTNANFNDYRVLILTFKPE